MSENLKLYEMCKEVPKEAQKEIKAGRLRGMTDINPMWRIKKLTEMFGPVGFGWYYEILDEKIEYIEETKEKVVFTKINLFIKYSGEWSKPIQGTGGNKLVTKESKGLHVSDECFKMSLTDAISVACKSIGIGGKVYWSADRTKYVEPTPPAAKVNANHIKSLHARITNKGITEAKKKKYLMDKFNLDSSKDLNVHQYNQMMDDLDKVPDKKEDKKDENSKD
jgi:hypothetical protein